MFVTGPDVVKAVTNEDIDKETLGYFLSVGCGKRSSEHAKVECIYEDDASIYLSVARYDTISLDALVLHSEVIASVVKVYVKKGDKVKADDTLFTMEAMKMQSNYKVSSDCTIKDVLIAEGDSVGADQILVKLELNEQ